MFESYQLVYNIANRLETW